MFRNSKWIATYVLNPEDELLNTIFTLKWNPADYGIPTEIKYKIDFAKSGPNFTEVIEAGSTYNTYLFCNIQ